MPQLKTSSLSEQPRQQPLFATPLDELISRMLSVMPAETIPVAHSTLGCSRATPIKHRILVGLVEWLLAMNSKTVQAGAPFVYIGTHEGQGFYRRPDGEPMVGSPLIALDAMDRHPMFQQGKRYKAILCERDAGSVRDLERAISLSGLGARGDVQVVRGSFEERLAPLVDKLPERGRGLLFTDPNGLLSAGELVDLSRNPGLANVDFVCWMNAAAGSRFRGLSPEAKQTTWKNVPPQRYETIREILASIAKERWIIRTPFSGGYGSHWTFAIGSRWTSFPEWRAERFFWTESLDGQRALMLCDGKVD